MEVISCVLEDELLQNIINMVSVMEAGLYLKEVYKLNIDGEVKYLLVEGNVYLIVNLEDGVFSSIDVFAIKDDKIDFMTFHDSNLVVRGDECYIFDKNYLNEEFEENDEIDDLRVAFEYYQDEDYPVLESIRMNPIEPFRNRYCDYNAVLCHTKSNWETKARVHSFSYYNASFDGKDKINNDSFIEPYMIKMIPLDHRLSIIDDKTYYLTEWSREYPYYDVALLKTIGITRYLFKKYKSIFSFYYNKPVLNGDGEVLLGNLLTSGMFDIGDIKKKLFIRGLSLDISAELIKLFNGEDENYKLCMDIYNEVKKVRESNKKLILFNGQGGSYGKNSR